MTGSEQLAPSINIGKLYAGVLQNINYHLFTTVNKPMESIYVST